MRTTRSVVISMRLPAESGNRSCGIDATRDSINGHSRDLAGKTRTGGANRRWRG